MTAESVVHLGDAVDYAACRFYGGPLGRDDLVDVVTIMGLVNGQIARVVRRMTETSGPTRRLLVLGWAVRCVRREMQWWRDMGPALADETVMQSADKLMHVLARMVTVLERETMASQEPRLDAAS